MQDLQQLLHTNAVQQHYGSAFLLAYGLTWLICGILSMYFSHKKIALAILFQSAVALPLTFVLMHFTHIPFTSSNHLIGQLAMYLAMSQGLGIPLIIYVYIHDFTYVPFAFATILGMHFLAYTWLNQTKVYLLLSISIVLGSWVIMRIKKEKGFIYICLYMSLLLLSSGFYLFHR